MMESDEGQGGGPSAMLRVFKQGNTVASRKQVGSQPAHATQAGRQAGAVKRSGSPRPRVHPCLAGVVVAGGAGHTRAAAEPGSALRSKQQQQPQPRQGSERQAARGTPLIKESNQRTASSGRCFRPSRLLLLLL